MVKRRDIVTEEETIPMWRHWIRDLSWGLFLYGLALLILFFVFAQTESSFLYVAF